MGFWAQFDFMLAIGNEQMGFWVHFEFSTCYGYSTDGIFGAV